MDTITTDYKYNFTKAENNLFSWSSFDGTSGNMLTHKPSGRMIYQMHFIDPTTGYQAEKIEGELRDAVLSFWDELATLQAQKPHAIGSDYADPEPEHGVNGYCRKCHSYCYGDCES